MKNFIHWLPRLLVFGLGVLGTAVPARDLATAIDTASATVQLSPPSSPGWNPAGQTQQRFIWRVEERHSGDAGVIAIGHDAVLGSGRSADAVTAVFGNTRVDGPTDNVVAVFGDDHVNSRVSGNVVAVFGNVELGPQADIDGDVVVIGGRLQRDPQANVHGAIQQLFGDHSEWLRPWVNQGLLHGRPLALVAGLGWAWFAALTMLVIYLLLALAFPRGIVRCARTLADHPGPSCLAALLVLLLSPILFFLLVITVVGIAVVPVLALALFLAGLFGKAVVFAWFGRLLLRARADESRAHTVLAVFIGGAATLLLYLIPFAGFLFYKLIGLLGIGAVVYTLVLAQQQRGGGGAAAAGMPPSGITSGAAGGSPSSAQPSAAPAPMTAEGPAQTDAADASAAAATETQTGQAPPDEAAASGAATSTAAATTTVPLSTLPRAGFWIRMAALFLDAVLVGIVVRSAIFAGGSDLLLLAAYGAVMWKLKGTTVGGIVCGLGVVRLDGRPIDWSTAIVRALGCFLSMAVVLLGFIWIAFDPERQAWHDKIAGTVVVRVPRGTSLV